MKILGGGGVVDGMQAQKSTAHAWYKLLARR